MIRLPPTATRMDRLPRCAWLAKLSRQGYELRIGDWVECPEGFVAEGAWAGDFSAGGCRSSPFRSGSGILFHEPLTIFAPTHPLHPVFVFVTDGFECIASNSLALLLAAHPEALPDDLGGAWRGRVGDGLRGFRRYFRSLYRNSAGEMRQLAWGCLELDLDARRMTEISPFVESAEAPFSTFAGYRDHLVEILRSTSANASDERRRRRYERLVSTVSVGYDSAACAALSRAAGCVDTVTLTTARGGWADSGAAVAAALGMRVREYAREATLLERRADENHFLPPDVFGPEDVEFLAEPNTANDLVFAPFADELAGTIFVTGFHGGQMWSRGCPSGPEIIRRDNSGAGMNEFRLRVGFVHLVAPFIGAHHAGAISAITESAELEPYRVDYAYDKPIARRILEESGVPRSAFGRIKVAGSAHVRRTSDDFAAAFGRRIAAYGEALGTMASEPLAAAGRPGPEVRR